MPTAHRTRDPTVARHTNSQLFDIVSTTFPTMIFLKNRLARVPPGSGERAGGSSSLRRGLRVPRVPRGRVVARGHSWESPQGGARSRREKAGCTQPPTLLRASGAEREEFLRRQLRDPVGLRGLWDLREPGTVRPISCGSHPYRGVAGQPLPVASLPPLPGLRRGPGGFASDGSQCRLPPRPSRLAGASSLARDEFKKFSFARQPE